MAPLKTEPADKLRELSPAEEVMSELDLSSCISPALHLMLMRP